MNNKHLRTLKAIFSKPVAANIRWSDIESLFIHLGAIIKEGNGSRVRININGVYATFHRPHPNPETNKGAVIDVQRLLRNAGVNYDNEIQRIHRKSWIRFRP